MVTVIIKGELFLWIYIATLMVNLVIIGYISWFICKEADGLLVVAKVSDLALTRMNFVPRLGSETNVEDKSLNGLQRRRMGSKVNSPLLACGPVREAHYRQ